MYKRDACFSYVEKLYIIFSLYDSRLTASWSRRRQNVNILDYVEAGKKLWTISILPDADIFILFRQGRIQEQKINFVLYLSNNRSSWSLNNRLERGI